MSTSCSGFGAGRRHVMFKKRAYLRIVEISSDNPHYNCSPALTRSEAILGLSPCDETADPAMNPGSAV